MVVVKLDKSADLGVKVSGQEVAFREDAMLEGLVPALDLTLGLGMHWSAANIGQSLSLDIICELPAM